MSLKIELAQQAVDEEPSSGAYWNTLGVAQYRAGEFTKSIYSLEKSEELKNKDASNWDSSFNWFFLAMSHWQLGDKEEARQWFDKGAQWMDAKNAKSESMIRFRSEAAELLGVNEPQAPSDPQRQEN